MTPLPQPLDTTTPGHTAPMHDALPPGSSIDEFEIVRVLGAGGFGIVYLAHDQILQRDVAIKEYMPNAIAGRGSASQVAVRSSANERTFEMGLESFINEARLLASFDHPSLVKVHRFSKANGTAYMVMPYYPGQTLKEARQTMRQPPDEAWLRSLLDPLLGALEALHAHDVYHRDIAPDNILMLADGRPVVLDFGSARRVIGDRTQSLTAILKPNFAPVEQYADEAGMRQGPYTDIFALGATVHYLLTGTAPMPAVMRAVRDSMPLLASPQAPLRPGVSSEFLAVIDWMLSLAPQERPQTVAEIREALRGALTPPVPTPRHEAIARFESPDFRPSDALAKTQAFPKTALEPARASVAPPVRARSARVPRRAATWAAGLATVGMLSLGAWGLTQSPSTTAAPTEQVVAARVETPAVSAPALAPVSMVTTATLPAPAASAASAASTPVTSASTHAVAAPVRMASVDTPRRAALESAAARRRDSAPTAAAVTAPIVIAAAPAAAPAAPTPEFAPLCAGKGFFATGICVSRACEAPALRNHPQCVEQRRFDEQHQRRMDR